MTAASSGSGLRPRATADLLALRALTRILLGERSLADTLREVAQIATLTVPGVEEASITLEGDGVRVSAFSGSLAASLDEWQYEAGFGPCLGAATSGVCLRCDDTACEELYPEFAALAHRQGVTSILAIPLPMPSRLSGALGLYRLHRDEPMTREAETIATSFAGYAGVAVANAALFAERERHVTQLAAALESRSVIDQAKGAIMAAKRCDAATAFQVLVSLSSKSNRKVRAVALDIVTPIARGEDLHLP